MPTSTALAGLVVAVVTLAGLFLPAQAEATTVRYASLETLVDVSDLVVRAEVTKRRSFYDEKRGRILTHTTLEVGHRYVVSSSSSSSGSSGASGASTDTLVIEQFGGTTDGRTTVVPGDASFALGERVLVFLRRIPDRDVWALSALAQSKYRVSVRDGVRWVRRELSGLNFVAPEVGGRDGRDAASPFFRLEGIPQRLETFEERLQAVLDAKKAREQGTGDRPAERNPRGGRQ